MFSLVFPYYQITSLPKKKIHTCCIISENCLRKPFRTILTTAAWHDLSIANVFPFVPLEKLHKRRNNWEDEVRWRGAYGFLQGAHQCDSKYSFCWEFVVVTTTVYRIVLIQSLSACILLWGQLQNCLLSKFECTHFMEIKLDTVTFCPKKNSTGEGNIRWRTFFFHPASFNSLPWGVKPEHTRCYIGALTARLLG